MGAAMIPAEASVLSDRWSIPFHPAFLEEPAAPIDIALFSVGQIELPRWNHYLVKERGAAHPLPMPATLAALYGICARWLLAHDIPSCDRWAHLTVDTKPVLPGETQREPGWHIDGMQGDEVPLKQVPDLTFIWSDVLPTRFFSHPISMSGFNGSVHDIHRWIQRAVIGREHLVTSPPCGIIRLIDPYVPHAGSHNDARSVMPRTFVRLVFSKTPVTSRKMTINPAASYGYAVHSTTGDIPRHLL